MEDKDKSSQPTFRLSLHGLPYSETIASKPPVLGASAIPEHPNSPVDKSLTPEEPSAGNGNNISSSSAKDTSATLQSTAPTASSLSPASSLPKIRVDDEKEKVAERRWLLPIRTKSTTAEQKPQELFQGIPLDIPTGDFGNDLLPETIKFSKRGSMLLDGKRNGSTSSRRLGAKLEPIADSTDRRPQSRTQARPYTRILSTDEEVLSEKVRSYYAFGCEVSLDNDGQSSIANRIGLRWQDALSSKTEGTSVTSLSRATSTDDVHSEVASPQNGHPSPSGALREEHELAGGIEDWQDVDNADVDRYGFIVPKSDSASGLNRSLTAKLTRVSTSLQLATETPRRKHTIRRSPSSAQGRETPDMHRSPSGKGLRRPMSSHSAGLTRRATFRSKDRKAMDQASDMLTLPRTASALHETGQPASEDPRARRKEIERQEKWRKMAIPVTSDTHGGGMDFKFDTSDPKLVERTWKGIPDKWRATAWHAFLSASAKKRKDSLSDEELVAAFGDYQTQSSPDDVQIDIDVPRTISSHIMFRRRYRGGQRLLFRVLHAMSLHFEDTGYVQGMAALAATLLAYYEEEKAFVMLARLWELRGLEKLYKSGFGGLMAALEDFETKWLGAGELAKKLVSLNTPNQPERVTDITCRLTSTSYRLPTGRGGISPCSTTRSPFLLSYECGTSSCF